MSFDISCHLTFHVILVIIEIIVNKVIMALILKVVIKDRCVFKKWVLRSAHGALLDSHRALSRITRSLVQLPTLGFISVAKAKYYVFK